MSCPLKRQLGISQDKKIPKTLLAKVDHTPLNKTCKNPTKTGDRKIKATPLLKYRIEYLKNKKR